MSADLFAAFSDDPPGPSQRQHPVSSASSNGPPPVTSAATDPFSFMSTSRPTQPPQQSSQQTSLWPSFQPQQQSGQPQQQQPTQWPAYQESGVLPHTSGSHGLGSLASFGGGASAKKLGQTEKEEDDDGWGDFEVAASEEDAMPPPAPDRVLPALSISSLVANSSAVPITRSEPSPRTRVMRASTLDLMTNNLVDTRFAPTALEPWQERVSIESFKPPSIPSARTPNPDPSVLFDADDFDGVAPPEDDEDDFGDFETVAAALPPATVTAASNVASTGSALDLISDLDFGSGPGPGKAKKEPPSQLLSPLSPQDSPYPQAPRSPSFQERNPFPGLGLTTPKTSEFPKEVKPESPSPVTAWPTCDDQKKDGQKKDGQKKDGQKKDGQKKKRDSFDDSWGAFEDLPAPSQPAATAAKPKTKSSLAAPKVRKGGNPAQGPSSDWDWDAWEGVDSPKPEPGGSIAVAALPDRDTGGPPPTNVPPPSILLSLFPELLSLPGAALFKPLNSQPASVKDRVLADPSTMIFLRGYLALATVGARVIAGRKLRWHRDKFLSQGMTISSAGGKGGMKLSGIDKTQARSEDREAADVVAAWKENVGRLRSAVVAANANAAAAGEPPLRVPELAETVVAQTAKGAVAAPKPCAVCGLKREERIPRVDFDVEDSFGEWWIEHWGHRTCRNFWLEHETRLRQR